MNWWIILCLILLVIVIIELVFCVKQTNRVKKDENEYYESIVDKHNRIHELEDRIINLKYELNDSQTEIAEANEHIESLNEQIESLQERLENTPVNFAANHIISPIAGNIEYKHMGFSYPRVLGLDEEEAYILECKIENEMFKAVRDSLLSSLTTIEVRPDPVNIGYQVICEVPIVKTLVSPNDSTVNPEEKYPIVNVIEKIKRGV